MTDNTFELPPPPPPGQRHNDRDEGMVVTYVDGLMQECYEVRERLDDQADRNNNLHNGNCRTEPPRQNVTPVDLNRIRNVDIAHVQVQTEETPRVKLSARETAEPPLAFLDTRVDVGDLETNGALKSLLATIDPASWNPAPGPDGVAADPPDPQPLSDKDKAIVEAAIAQGLLPPAALVLVSDRTCAEAEQTVFDAMWDECGADFYLREAAFRKTIIGWQFVLYGFDDGVGGGKKRHTLFNPSHLLVFMDPLCTDVRDASHAEVLQFIDLYKAKAVYPKFADEFDAAVIQAGGHMESGSRLNFRIPATYSNTQFRRPMVPVRHCWIRDYPMPMTPEDAIAAGRVARGRAVDRAGTPAVLAEDGTELEPAQDAVERDCYCTPADEMGEGAQEITEGGPAWPTVPRIRQIGIVGDSVVLDGATEFGEMPLGHMVDLPLIDSPYGQGQPEALEPLQLALNALLTDIVNYFHFFGTPSVAMPMSVAARMQGFKEGVYSLPIGEVWEIPDDLIQRFGEISKIIGFIDPPTIPAEFWRFFDLLLMLIDKEGQVTEALEGQAKQGWSGDLVARLQQAARGLIGWKSQRMETAIQWLAKLMLHSINTRLTLEDLGRYCSKYPSYVWAAIRERRKSVDVDVTVEIVSGSGQVREKTKQESIALNRNGEGPLSDTTLLERFNEDPKVELQNKITEAEERAKAAAQIQGVGGVPAVGAPAAPAPSPPQGQPVAAAA